MNSVHLNATVGEDRVLTIQLPNEINPGEVSVFVENMVDPRKEVEETFAIVDELRKSGGMISKEYKEFWRDCKKERDRR